MPVVITNTGRVVDAFTLEVLGPAGAWSRCEPPVVSVFPNQSADVAIIFAPPRDASAPAGELGFGLHVRSHEDPPGSVVEEGWLAITAVPIIAAEMSPRTGKARGRRRSRHVVAIDNTGNAGVTVALVGVDDTEEVDVEFDQQHVDVAAGAAVFVTVKARATRPFFRGSNQARPFIVEANAPERDTVRMSGTLLNEPRMPGWLPKAALLAVVAAGLLAFAWFGMFKPVLKDTATNAANNALAAAGLPTGSAAGDAAAVAKKKAADAATKAKAAAPTVTNTAPTNAAPTNAAPTNAAPPTAPLPPPTPVPASPTVAGAPFALQLTTIKPILTADATHQVSVTDLVFENSAADKGQLVITNGPTTLFTIGLSDFRQHDLHFVTPIIVATGNTLNMQISCLNPAPAKCSASTLVVGTTSAVVNP